MSITMTFSDKTSMSIVRAGLTYLAECASFLWGLSLSKMTGL